MMETDMRYDIREFGAIGDGKTVNTEPIAAAVAAAASAGGGTVVVPPGIFVTGVFGLASHVTLELTPGSVLKGSGELSDYELDGERTGLMYTKDAEHVAIVGQGTIDGNGMQFMSDTHVRHRPDGYSACNPACTRQGEAYLASDEDVRDGPVRPLDRPCQMLCFVDCKHVQLRDVTIQEPAHWTLRFGNCDRVSVQGVTIENNMLVPNNDGIHCTQCTNVRISDCDIRAGDDCIAFTGFFDHPGHGFGNPPRDAEHLAVTNCILSSASAGIRIGAGQSPVRNVTITNCVMRQVHRGVVIWQRDGNTLENIRISNLMIHTRLLAGKWWGQAEPIAISSVRRREDTRPGMIRHVHISQITAHTEGGIMLYSETPGEIEDVLLDDVRLYLHNSPANPTHGGNFDLRPVEGRPKLAIFKHDLYPVYARGVDNLVVRNLAVERDADMPDWFHGKPRLHGCREAVVDGEYTG